MLRYFALAYKNITSARITVLVLVFFLFARFWFTVRCFLYLSKAEKSTNLKIKNKHANIQQSEPPQKLLPGKFGSLRVFGFSEEMFTVEFGPYGFPQYHL